MKCAFSPLKSLTKRDFSGIVTIENFAISRGVDHDPEDQRYQHDGRAHFVEAFPFCLANYDDRRFAAFV